MTFFNSIELEKELPPMPVVRSEQMRIFLASRNVLADYYDVKQMELKLSRHTIKAPFNGSFIEVYMEVGAYVNTGGRVAKIIATDILEVEIPVENTYARWIRKGDPVNLLSPDELISTKWTGTVTRISDFLDITTQSRSVFTRVPVNLGSPLYVGQYLQAEFEGGIVENVMEIPRNALFNYNEVFIIVEGLLKIQHIELIKLNEKTALVRGIEENTYIVTQPMISVAENTPVKILGVD